MALRLGACGGLNENGPPQDHIFEWPGLQFVKLFWDGLEGVASQLLLQYHPCLPAAKLSHDGQETWPLTLHAKPPENAIFHKLPWLFCLFTATQKQLW